MPKMEDSSYILLIYLIFLSASAASSQVVSTPVELSSLIETLEPTDCSSGRLYILMPANSNLTDILINDKLDFNLFKLNTDVLSDNGNIRSKRSVEKNSPTKLSLDNGRTPKKINLFRNLLNKQRFSPLYLINGTVCRFVNSGPICTTISTNGLPGK